MFLFQYHEDSLRLLEEERKRDERRNRLLREIREIRELRSAASPVGAREAHSQAATARTPAYAGPERRLVPCPDMKEAMTP
jgi:hypothetical protein